MVVVLPHRTWGGGVASPEELERQVRELQDAFTNATEALGEG